MAKRWLFLTPDLRTCESIEKQIIKSPVWVILLFWQGRLSNSRTNEIKDLLQFGKEIKVFLQIVYDENNLRTIVLEHSPTQAIPRHYNIKPDLEDLEFANKCSYDLSRISQLVIRKTGNPKVRSYQYNS